MLLDESIIFGSASLPLTHYSLISITKTRTMNSYLISFDLVSPGRNYQPVYDYMEKYTDRMKPLQTVYLIQSARSAEDILNDLQKLVDSNDKVLVININTKVWATYNLPNTAKWLNNH
jgi:enoyl reductase-like protein